MKINEFLALHKFGFIPAHLIAGWEKWYDMDELVQEIRMIPRQTGIFTSIGCAFVVAALYITNTAPMNGPNDHTLIAIGCTCLGAVVFGFGIMCRYTCTEARFLKSLDELGVRTGLGIDKVLRMDRETLQDTVTGLLCRHAHLIMEIETGCGRLSAEATEHRESFKVFHAFFRQFDLAHEKYDRYFQDTAPVAA